ncbi:pilus assembly PilX N-terminal domain-containing protein [Desulfobacter sp.]|uniref:pilus assembly PilX N-terminal domain-containing protein n=1 Tax=Desulfobacter sp. TaxID=2294 RepID=UPI00257E647E|nr:pilus assembly PilX N-terminal domain-containing protein [Desulfobacter sp.]
MNKKANILNNDSGSTILLAVIFLFLATVLGISIMNTSTMEIRIAGVYKISKMVFYAADSGVHYVAVNPDWYGSNNLDPAQPLNFPDPANPATTYTITNELNVGGTVTYQGKSQMTAGSGFSAGEIMAIRYQIQSTGTSNTDANNQINAGFYRIGL